MITLANNPLCTPFKLEIKQANDSHQLNQQHHFTVPKNVQSVSIEVKNEQYMWLTYIIHDQQKVRGQFLKGSTPQPLIIHQEQEKSSPYTTFGVIQDGEWTLDLSIIAREEVKANNNWCTITITFNESSDINNQADLYLWQASQQSESLLHVNNDKVFNKQKGWYKGDFHTHTTFSDGKMTREENMVSAKNQKLDFFVATDHNLVPTSWFDETEILVIPGVEVTSPVIGHFNIISTNNSPFGNNRLVDMFSEEGMNRILTDDYGDAVISINHPFLPNFKWKITKTPLEKVDAMEIWNDPTFSDNIQATELALQAWNHLLNAGYRITGIGGSDSHNKPTEIYDGSSEPSLIGDPGTFVHCKQLTAKNIVDSVKAGHVIVSRGELIQFQIEDFISGDVCNLQNGVANASVDTERSIYFEWIVDGKVVKKDKGNYSNFHFNFKDESRYHWIRIDVRNEDGSLYGFSNPIYFGEKEPTIKIWGEILQLMEEG